VFEVEWDGRIEKEEDWKGVGSIYIASKDPRLVSQSFPYLVAGFVTCPMPLPFLRTLTRALLAPPLSQTSPGVSTGHKSGGSVSVCVGNVTQDSANSFNAGVGKLSQQSA
jgi:hypothetical protein